MGPYADATGANSNLLPAHRRDCASPGLVADPLTAHAPSPVAAVPPQSITQAVSYRGARLTVGA